MGKPIEVEATLIDPDEPTGRPERSCH